MADGNQDKWEEIGGNKSNTGRRKIQIKVVINIYGEVREDITSMRKEFHVIHLKRNIQRKNNSWKLKYMSADINNRRFGR